MPIDTGYDAIEGLGLSDPIGLGVSTDGRIGRRPATGAEYAYRVSQGYETRRNVLDASEGANYSGGSSYTPGLPLLPSSVGLAGGMESVGPIRDLYVFDEDAQKMPSMDPTILDRRDLKTPTVEVKTNRHAVQYNEKNKSHALALYKGWAARNPRQAAKMKLSEKSQIMSWLWRAKSGVVPVRSALQQVHRIAGREARR